MKRINTNTMRITVLAIVVVAAVLADNEGEDLYNAARAGKLDEVNSALAQPGVDIEWKNSKAGYKGYTALYVASMHNHVDVVQALITSGANVNVTTDNGITPISVASGAGNTEMVIMFVEASAGVDIPNKWGRTPLMSATEKGHTSTVEALISAHANVALADRDGDTALHYAARGNQAGTADQLLLAGAPTGKTNKAGQTAGALAREEDYTYVADIIDGTASYTTPAPTTTTPSTTTVAAPPAAATTTTATTEGNTAGRQIAGYFCGLSVFFIVMCV